MSAELMRSYLDILNEQQQPQRLDEGVVQDLAAKAATKSQSNTDQIPK